MMGMRLGETDLLAVVMLMLIGLLRGAEVVLIGDRPTPLHVKVLLLLLI